MSLSKNLYSKSPTTIPQQIELLQSKGLIIEQKDLAAALLSNIGYFRFIAYCRPFQLQNDNLTYRFRPDSHFSQIYRLYDFDRKLRLLVLEAIERIEVAFRTQLNDAMALAYGAWWYTQSEHFTHVASYTYMMKEIVKQSERKDKPVLQHYYERYSAPELPPCWMIAECLSLGTWSKLFDILAERNIKKQVADKFGLTFITLSSWMRALTDVRNCCAHHERLWNNFFPRAPEKIPLSKIGHRKFYQMALCMAYLLRKIDPSHEWQQSLIQLIEQYPEINLTAMGFEENWQHNLNHIESLLNNNKKRSH